ncbi:MAG: hypothetical protein ACR2J0_02420 [Mycobacteriales bacterium]
MGFLDKARDAAQQAATKAQQGMAQGQAKLGEVQAKRASDALLRDLGAAFYAEQRQGGSSEAVVSALRAIDTHVAQNGPIDTSSSPDGGMPSGTGTPPPPTSAAGTPPPSPAAPPTPGGDFKLDDL